MLLAVLRSSRASRWRFAPLQLAVGACAPVRSRAAVVVARFVSTPPGSGADGKNLDQKLGNQKPLRRTTPWEKKILAALKAYKEVQGDTLVPRSFVVPFGDERWPPEARGYRLGNAVNYLREKVKAGKVTAGMEDELQSLDFVENVAQYRWDRTIMPAFCHFHELHGHTDVPQRFVVPTGDSSWPESTWGWKLGRTVIDIRSGKAYAAQVEKSKEELKKLLFCYETTTYERDWRETILPSLKVFSETFHHCIVDTAFKVPAMQPWPEKAWNMRLGKVVNMIRIGENYLEQSTRDRSILDEIGFAWNRDLSTYNELIIPSVEVYVALHGTWRMSQGFVVPECDPWPRRLWKLDLGRKIYDMRYHGTYFTIIGRDVERLERLGFRFELSEQAWKRWVVPLLDTYQVQFGDRHVPRDFVVPSEAPWPEEMWGVWLGYIIARNSRHLL